jgi:uroporphyrinogen-III decarboxylase
VLNSKERVQRTLEHEAADKIPFWGDFTSIESQIVFFGRKFFEADPLTQILYQARFLNTDVISVPIVGYPGCYDIFCDKISEGDDYVISRNPFGGLHYWRKKPYFANIIHSPVVGKEDLDSIPRLELSKFDSRIKTFAEQVKALRECGYYVLAEIKGPFETPWMFLRGLRRYMMDLATDPGFITRMIEFAFPPIMDLTERVVDEAAPDGIWVTDDLGESRNPFLSVDKYRQIYKPWHRQLVNRLHNKGMKVFLHSHGNVMSLVGEFVDAGFDSLDPLDSADNMRLSEVKSKYGNQIMLTGGITKQIGTMAPGEMSAHLGQVVRDAGPEGLILNCAGGIPPEMPLANYMHFATALEQVREIRAEIQAP